MTPREVHILALRQEAADARRLADRYAENGWWVQASFARREACQMLDVARGLEALGPSLSEQREQEGTGWEWRHLGRGEQARSKDDVK